MRVQFQLSIFAGAPIFIIMPMLIYLPTVWWYFRHSLGIFGTSTAAESMNQRRRLQKFSLYWEDRFAFARLRWVAFIAFMAASTGIQATPSPGIACSGTDFVQDPSFTCYSEELAGTHAMGTVVTVLLCVVFPVYIYKNIRRISFNDLEEDSRERLRFGPFFGCYRKGVWQYFVLLNHFQMTVLIAVLSLALSKHALGLAISNLVLNLLYILIVLVGQPFEFTLDNVLEAATTAVQAYSILLSIIPIVDANAVGDHTREVPMPPSAHMRPRALHLKVPLVWGIRSRARP
jgi:hypothetical protein